MTRQEQIDAENYSTVANKDDGSCYYAEPSAKSATATITNWTFDGTSYVAIMPYSEITSDVIENGTVNVFMETGTNVWSPLPITNYNTGTYSTTIEVSITVGQVILSITNSDLSTPTTPISIVFKVSVVS